MELSPEYLSECFLHSLSPAPELRRAAEGKLTEASYRPNFGLAVLRLVAEPSVDEQIRHAAAVNFKNHLRSRWAPSPESSFTPIVEDEKHQIKGLIVTLMLSSNPRIQSQLSESVYLIVKHDFPKSWPNLLPELVANLNTALRNNDSASINGILAPEFERCLFPIFGMILGKGETEFIPYAFQLFALLIELSRPPISSSYMQIFDCLMSPDAWKRNSNVPSFVRFLQAILQKIPHELNQQGRLSQVLGIFNQLVQSPSTDEQGFYVVNTLIENLEYGVLAPYMVHIWFPLFTRLQNNRTMKFDKLMLIFMSLFLVKHGPGNLVDTMNTVQHGIFLRILELLIPKLKLIAGRIEVKLAAVASTRLICESPALLDATAARHWGETLDSIVTLLSRPEEDRVAEEQEMPDIAENFVNLYNAGKKEEDPLKDIKDPKQFLVVSLANLSARSPGRFPQIISEKLEPANQTALLQFCNTYSCPIV